MYKPTRGNIVPATDSLCTEIHSQKAGSCETCQQCDYEIQYADHSSSFGVLARDELQLRSANGSLTHMKIIFGYLFSPGLVCKVCRHFVSYITNLKLFVSLKVCI